MIFGWFNKIFFHCVPSTMTWISELWMNHFKNSSTAKNELKLSIWKKKIKVCLYWLSPKRPDFFLTQTTRCAATGSLCSYLSNNGQVISIGRRRRWRSLFSKPIQVALRSYWRTTRTDGQRTCGCCCCCSAVPRSYGTAKALPRARLSSCDHPRLYVVSLLSS